MKVSKRSLYVLIPVVVFMLIFTASCGGQPPAETPDLSASLTAGVSTFAAYFFQTQTAMVTPATQTPTPTMTATVTPVTPTALTPLPTSIVFFPVATQSLVPAATITGTNYTRTAVPAASGCNNLQLLDDFAVVPYHTMQINSAFTKSWRVMNAGTCNWVAGYRFVLVSGTDMGVSTFSVRNPPIIPGQWQQYSISLTAPSRAGTYTATYQMRDGAGNRFGSLLTVTITVRTVYP